jgi:hypothetical protein
MHVGSLTKQTGRSVPEKTKHRKATENHLTLTPPNKTTAESIFVCRDGANPCSLENSIAKYRSERTRIRGAVSGSNVKLYYWSIRKERREVSSPQAEKNKQQPC